MQPRWILVEDSASRTNGIDWPRVCASECIAQLLRRKGFARLEDVQAFLDPRLSRLGDPFLISGMHAIVERILTAIDRKERIVLFGDYDVDGVTSLALLATLLRDYGTEPALFLPHRIEEGYGLNAESVARCVREHAPQLLIAIDCGTSSLLEIGELRGAGVDVIVVDHHEPKDSVPDCLLVNPKASDSGFDYLCSAGLTFKLCHALLKARRAEFDLKSALDLVALGTVADIVPLRGDNRVLVKKGAAVLGHSRRPGLVRLMSAAGVRAPVMPEDIGFRLGPRLNAAGRLATAEQALRLLLTDDWTEAETLAIELERQNRERQEVERQVLHEAEEQVANCFQQDRHAGIVVGKRGWHPGVLGIVASRLSKKYHRPTIVVGFDDSGAGKGSGRSIEGCSMVGTLSECGMVEKWGGHEMAAGLSLREQEMPRFRDEFLEATRRQLSDEALTPCLTLDAEIALADVSFELLRWHEQMQPFGNDNPQPLFVSAQVDPAAPPRVVGERHLALRLKQRNWQQRAIFFDGCAEPLPSPPWDVAYRVSANVYEGDTRLQLEIKALRSSCPLR